MRSFFYALSICLSCGLVYGITTDCNYVVDYFWASVESPTNPPTVSPSPSPTTSPTDNPTPTPTTGSPTSINETTIHMAPTSPGFVILTTKTNDPKVDVGGNDYEADEAILKPLIFGYCYSFPNTHYYFGDFSLKYECDSNYYLHRTIYYETLHCDSSNINEITVQPWAQGTNSIKYVCDQPQNCNFAKIINSTATTMAPTPAPTDSPTESPSVAPSSSPTASPTHTGAAYPAAPPTMVIGKATTKEGDIVFGGDDGDLYWWQYCDNITASEPTDTSNQIVSYFAENICVSVDLFSNVFSIDEDKYCDYGDICSLTDLSFGWYCDHDQSQYFMGVFKDQNCANIQERLIVYTNDSCIPKIATNEYYKAYWTYVECGAQDAPTLAVPSVPTNPILTIPSVPSTPTAPTIAVPSVPTNPILTISVPSTPTAPTVPTIAVPSVPTVGSDPSSSVPSTNPEDVVDVFDEEKGNDPTILINFTFVFGISIVVLYLSM